MNFLPPLRLPPAAPLVAPPADLSVGPTTPTRPNVVATLAAGAVGRRMLAVSGPLMRRYAERVGADFHAIEVGEVPYPLGEKFRVRTLFDHWERVLFLDADVIVTDRCPDLFGTTSPDRLAVHDDLPDVAPIAGTGWLRAEYAHLGRSQGWEVPPGFVSCLNSGVVVAGRAHRGAWDPPERPYPGTHCGEQNVFNWRARDLPKELLPSALNYQWWAHEDLSGPALVWHFARPQGRPDCTEERRLELMGRAARGEPVAATPAPAALPTPAVALPPCRWRGPRGAGGLHPCSSSKVVVRGAGVPAEFCAGGCPFRDHEPTGRARPSADAAPAPTGGPGTELKALLADMGVTEKAGCGCADKARLMDARGPAWCRDNRALLVDWLREAAGKMSFFDRLKAGARAAWHSPLDPVGALVDEAVRRAEAKTAAASPPAGGG